MRLVIVSLLSTAMLVFSVATAQAVSFSFVITGGSATVGDSLDLEIYVGHPDAAQLRPVLRGRYRLHGHPRCSGGEQLAGSPRW